MISSPSLFPLPPFAVTLSPPTPSAQNLTIIRRSNKMQRLISPILCVAFLAATVSGALAQADAQHAYQKAEAAYQAGNFAEARDLATKAAETDPNNPEVFLLLGKAHFQLGELDEAMAAWQRTLKLAPQQPFAARMLAALRGQAAEVDGRVRLIAAMIGERLFPPALQECGKLLAEKALTDPQRAKVMTLQAEALVRIGRYADAQKVLRELLTLYPQQADAAQTTLLVGQAKLRGDQQAVSEGLALLRKVVAEHAGTPAAATAAYELAAFDLRTGATAARAEAMAKWLAANPDHSSADEGRATLLDAYLGLARQGARPTTGSDLSPNDVKALALATEIYRRTVPARKADELTGKLLEHIKNWYVNNGAHAAAVKAIETLLAAPLPPTQRVPGRLSVLKALGFSKYQIAMQWLNDQARAGKLPQAAPRGRLPQPLADVVDAYQAIRKEYPAEPLWVDQAELAKHVRALAAQVLPSAEFKGLNGPDAWAMEIAFPVTKADADAAAVKSAVETVQGIVHDRAQVPQPQSQDLAVELSRGLLQALSPERPIWSGVIRVHGELLDGYARYLFNENVKAGKDQENAKLSGVQKELLATLAEHVAHEAGYAAAARGLLAQHLRPWIERGHWAVAEEAYTTLAKALPEAERRQAELAVVNLWIQQVTREHQRLTAAGLTVPRQLDPILAKALTRCYELQAGLEEEPSTLAQIRALSDAVVDHYKALEYDEVAEAAIAVKAEKPVEAADEYAAFQLAQLRDQQGRRALSRRLKQYGASERLSSKIAMEPALQQAIAAWKQFIADRPTSSFVSQAAEKIFAVANLYEQQGAFDVAADVYRDLAKFAAGVGVLSQSAPGRPSTADRAAFAVATALDAQARKTLQQESRERKSGQPPPAKLSEEYAAAIAAYKGFVAASPRSPLVGQALAKVMAVAYEYAQIDAWDVADSVYADLLGSKLAIQRPERLRFARGLCQLGRAMPDHARQILAALTSGGLRDSGERGGPGMLAAATDQTSASAPMVTGGGGLGGWANQSSLAAQPPPGIPTSQPAPGQSSVSASVPPASREPVPQQAASAEAQRDSQLLAMIRQQEANRAAQVARLREDVAVYRYAAPQDEGGQQQGQQAAQRAPARPVLSEAELKRQQAALDAAYEIFQGILKDYRYTPTAPQARGEILVMVGHWRTLGQWERSAALGLRFLSDNPTDQELPRLRLEIARDRLAWACKPIEQKAGKQAMLAEVAKRFEAARAELAKIVADFPKQRSYQQQAQWDMANSFLTQARVVDALSPTLARGQYVRAAKELCRVAERYPDHPQLGNIPQLLWNIAAELESRGYDEEAIVVWNELSTYDPMHPLSQQAAMKIASTYHQKLKRPLLAAEAYQELYFAEGQSNRGLLDAIFQIGSELKQQKRYVEALHVLGLFVDSFPQHPQAGQALTMVGQIHQTNEAWKDAIAAYRRVTSQFQTGPFVQEAKWAIAECTINLSQWQEASDAYQEYVKTYPQDGKVAEANRRIEVLKDLVRYQGLVDEKDQRKAFDAQYQIASIVASQLSNPVKAIIEYRKVVANWPESHLADDALYAVGNTYLSLGETQQAREALLKVAQAYPTSPLADDALFMVGKSYEDEADKLATMTRDQTLAANKDVAQRRAYQMARYNLSRQQEVTAKRIADLKAAGKGKSAAAEEAAGAANYAQFNDANVRLFAQQAIQEEETLTATQLADRQDKINAALRKAVEAYTAASKVAGADKAGDALLQMATIYDQRLKDSQAAMQTWLEIVRQFSGTAVAEDASWRIAQYYQREGKYAEAVDAYQAFLRNYRRSPKAGDAQFAVAENYERLGKWINAMDCYSNYINNFPQGPLVQKAKEQINWIKTYRL
jgi:tetratricopeptide (TPR) repeat protein